jgi:hypothetical protein
MFNGSHKPQSVDQLTLSRPETVKATGICTTCRHSATCLFLTAARHPVWHCDEFDGESSEVTNMAVAQPRLIQATGQPVSGLCSTCEDRETCTLRGTRSVVQTCEEYR